MAGASGLAQAQGVEVQGAWARATVVGQKATGVFMTLTARSGARLVGVSTDAAAVAEVHEMALDANNVMKMRAVPALELPAGRAVELKPGSYHIMLMDLKAPLPKDSSVLLTLSLQDAKGAPSRMELRVPVLPMAPAGGHHGMAH
ncbi:MAG: copper chaperone PCu(A)C [Rhodoferax sp.]